MPLFTFNKLVRDKLPSLYKELNQEITSRIVSGNELLKALRDKMIEEVAEIPFETNDRAKIINELSDVEQVLDDIKAKLAISDDEVTEAKKKKLLKKGGFSDGTYVETIRLRENDEWVDYYRQEPHKYPEIK